MVINLLYLNAIGQGEVLVTPIQLANMTAAICNRGHILFRTYKKLKCSYKKILYYTELKNYYKIKTILNRLLEDGRCF